MTEGGELSLDSQLRDLLQRAATAHEHGAEGARMEAASLGVAVSVSVVSEEYLITIWSLQGRVPPEEAQVRRVLAGMLTEEQRAIEQPSADYDRIFLVPRDAVSAPGASLHEPAPGAADSPADLASEQSFPASDPPAY